MCRGNFFDAYSVDLVFRAAGIFVHGTGNHEICAGFRKMECHKHSARIGRFGDLCADAYVPMPRNDIDLFVVTNLKATGILGVDT